MNRKLENTLLKWRLWLTRPFQQTQRCNYWGEWSKDLMLQTLSMWLKPYSCTVACLELLTKAISQNCLCIADQTLRENPKNLRTIKMLFCTVLHGDRTTSPPLKNQKIERHNKIVTRKMRIWRALQQMQAYGITNVGCKKVSSDIC